MTPENQVLVQKSFRAVVPISEQAAELFYGRLFELDASLRPLFRGDMKSQGQKLMQTLGVVVANADNLESLRPAVEGLGRRHAGYGVEDTHYETVGAALIWTLEKGLGDQFTPAVREAWVELYSFVANIMRAAAQEEVMAEVAG